MNNKRHQLIIIGNGFDLHFGLKSSYRDFYNSGIGRESNNLFLQLAKNEDFDWSDIETLLKNLLWCVNTLNLSAIQKITTSHSDAVFTNISGKVPPAVNCSQAEFSKMREILGSYIWKWFRFDYPD